MKNWYIELLVNVDGKIYNPSGTEYTIIYHDLKTLRGVLNRMKKVYPFDKKEKEVIGFKVYNYCNIYDDDTFSLVCECYNDSYLFKQILSEQHKHLED